MLYQKLKHVVEYSYLSPFLSPPPPFATPPVKIVFLLGSLKTLEQSHPLNSSFKSSFAGLAHSVMRVDQKSSENLGCYWIELFSSC